MAVAIKKVVGQAPLRKGKVTLDLPPIVENGNTVSLEVTVESPMTLTDHVKAIHVFNEKNPQPYVLTAHLGPRVLRMETACVAALALVKAKFGSASITLTKVARNWGCSSASLFSSRTYFEELSATPKLIDAVVP